GDCITASGNTQLIANCMAALTAAEYLDREELRHMRMGDGREAEFEDAHLVVGVDEEYLFYEVSTQEKPLRGGRKRPHAVIHGVVPTLDDAKFDAVLLGLQVVGRPTVMVHEEAARLHWKPCRVPISGETESC